MGDKLLARDVNELRVSLLGRGSAQTSS